jgi:hypothetical protein
MRWFAVDRDGRIAMFDAPNFGACPREVVDNEDIANGEVYIRAMLDAVQPSVPVDGTHARGPTGWYLMLGDRQAIARFASGAQTRDDGIILADFRPTTNKPAPFDALHAAGACRGCRADVDEDEHVRSVREVAERLGVYLFEGSDDGVAVPYERTYVPAAPLTAAKVSGVAAELPRFPGSFGAYESLQPFEHWPDTVSSSAAWVASNGGVRCAPGRDDDYAIEYDNLSAVYDDVEPPERLN